MFLKNRRRPLKNVVFGMGYDGRIAESGNVGARENAVETAGVWWLRRNENRCTVVFFVQNR